MPRMTRMTCLFRAYLPSWETIKGFDTKDPISIWNWHFALYGAALRDLISKNPRSPYSDNLGNLDSENIRPEKLNEFRQWYLQRLPVWIALEALDSSRRMVRFSRCRSPWFCCSDWWRALHGLAVFVSSPSWCRGLWKIAQILLVCRLENHWLK